MALEWVFPLGGGGGGRLTLEWDRRGGSLAMGEGSLYNTGTTLRDLFRLVTNKVESPTLLAFCSDLSHIGIIYIFFYIIF